MTERQEYESGLSLRIIAELRNIGKDVVKRRVVAQGGKMRPRGTNI